MQECLRLMDRLLFAIFIGSYDIIPLTNRQSLFQVFQHLGDCSGLRLVLSTAF
jgi:hypothetical protein